ncbi:MAG TPA: hypothetical protein PKD26_14995 [Pyrinomonadaceae bacterium]|nr:hypothetical protein [Pyrinomonadaceae bacterium]
MPLKSFLLVLLLSIFCRLADAQDDTRPAATWQVQKYDISVSMPQSEPDRAMTVKARLDLKNISPRPASTLTLRITPDADISGVNVGGSAVDHSKAEEKINRALSLQRLVLRIPTVAANGNVSASIDYKLNVRDNSGVSAISPVGAQFLPTSFWYPTPNSWFFARGADHAPFRIQITSAGLASISSGTEAERSFDSKLKGQPFFLTGSWDEVNANGVNVFLAKGSGDEERKRAAEIGTIAAEARSFVTGLLGGAPDVPIRIVSVRRGGGFSGGGTILLDDGVFRRGKLDSLTVMTVADAVAKMWIGGSTSVSGDGFGVIREGLTKYIATLFLENKYGKEIADVERLRQRTAYAAVSRRDLPLNLGSPLDDYYYAAVANKGSMAWRLLARALGREGFFEAIKRSLQDGDISLAELRSAFPNQKDLADHLFDQVTETNLMAGLPSQSGDEWKVALRNTGPIDVTVNVSALLANGERMSSPSTIRAKSFGEIVFKTPQKISRVEIDPDKYYPQTEYSDDVAPRETTENDLLLAVKRPFDKQEFAAAETMARTVLREHPRFDDVRILLARSLLGQNKNSDAEREFRAVLDERLPSSRNIAWALVGLAEVAVKSGRNADAARFAEEAIRADAEYGASLNARSIRNRSGAANTGDEGIKAFFTQFDRSAVSSRKAELDAMVLTGEIPRFAAGISGQAVEWRTTVLHVDRIDANNVWVEANLAIRMLDKERESGTAVYRLTRIGSAWKISGVEIFEVR